MDTETTPAEATPPAAEPVQEVKKRRRGKMTEEERLAKKRAYNRKWRADRGMKPRPASYSKADTRPKWTWSPERRAKFERTTAAKRKLAAENQHRNSHVEDTLEDPRGFINNCPHCGGGLQAFYLAAGAMKRRERR